MRHLTGGASFREKHTDERSDVSQRQAPTRARKDVDLPVATRTPAPPRSWSLPALDFLIEHDHLTAKQGASALAAAARDGRPLGDILREEHPGVPSPSSLDHPFVDLGVVQVDVEAVSLIPNALARRHGVLPIGFDGARMIVAMSDPTNVIALDDVLTATGRELVIVLADQCAIEDAWRRIDALDRSTETLLADAAPDQEEEYSDHGGAEDAPIVRAINQIIALAVVQDASDIHIEPQEHDVQVRFRLDGVLHEIMRVPKAMRAGMASRLKIMASLDIAERRVPQDGRITVVVGDHSVDLRMATVPSVWGEEVILRILDRGSSLLGLAELGFLPDTLALYERRLRKPHGAILVVGPTGSGKSTTLYSTLSVVNKISRKIITIEDPVEFRLPGITQIPVNPKAGLDFASALRSILRSDPDVLMVGEIRDTETARIAIEAAMTGHLVFSTLHTNDAPSAVTRLVEMGVERFLVASSLECVLAQRLARKLCSRCKESYVPGPKTLADVGLPKKTRLYRGVGCNECSGTGYRGRVALVELMPMTEEIETLTAEHGTSAEIRRVALEQGMRSLLGDGLEKARLGTTSLEEILRIAEGQEGAAPETSSKGDELLTSGIRYAS